MVLWLIGGALLTVLISFDSAKTAVMVALASVIGAMVTGALGFMQSEKVLRPITVAAMANDPDVIMRRRSPRTSRCSGSSRSHCRSW